MGNNAVSIQRLRLSGRVERPGLWISHRTSGLDSLYGLRMRSGVIRLYCSAVQFVALIIAKGRRHVHRSSGPGLVTSMNEPTKNNPADLPPGSFGLRVHMQ
jgi:hypothetical protein